MVAPLLAMTHSNRYRLPHLAMTLGKHLTEQAMHPLLCPIRAWRSN